jgi:ubiquitin C-terminal hydrolase
LGANIIEALFSPEKIHQQLLNRCHEVCRFLAENHKLTAQQLELIWDASQTAPHETLRHAVCAVIEQLAAHVSAEHLELLQNKFRGLALHDTQTLRMIRNFARFSSFNAATNRCCCLELVWELAQDSQDEASQSVPIVVQKQALDYMGEMVSWASARGQHRGLLEQCLQNLVVGRSVLQSLTIIQKVTSYYPLKGKRKKDQAGQAVPEPTQTSVLQSLLKNSLLEHFLADLQRYKQLAAERVAQLKLLEISESGEGEEAMLGGTPSLSAEERLGRCYATVNSTVLEGHTTHYEGLEERMVFLKFVVLATDLKLGKEELDVLFDMLVTRAITPKERNLCFHWMEQMLGYEAFTPAVTEYLFLSKFRSLLGEGNVSGAQQVMMPPCFILFRRLLHSVNLQRQVLQYTNKTSWRTLSFDILGLGTLWEIVLNAINEEVARKAILLLNDMRLYENLTPELAPSAPAHRSAHIEQCMENLSRNEKAMRTLLIERAQQQQASGGRPQPKPEELAQLEQCKLRVVRCLTTLHGYIENLERKLGGERVNGQSTIRHSRSFRAEPAAITAVSLCSQPYPTFEFKMHKNETIGTLRHRVAGAIARHAATQMAAMAAAEEASAVAVANASDGSLPITTQETLKELIAIKPWGVRLITNGKEVFEDAMSLRGANFGDEQKVHVTRHVNQPTIDAQQRSRQGSGVSFPQSLFDRLVGLLGCEDASVNHRAWDLLMLLPTSPGLVMQLHTLGESANSSFEVSNGYTGGAEMGSLKNRSNSWAELLTSQCIPRLLYTLQTMEALLQDFGKPGLEDPFDATPRLSAPASSWCRMVLETGGVGYMLQLLASTDFFADGVNDFTSAQHQGGEVAAQRERSGSASSSDDPLRLRCLVLLLRLLGAFQLQLTSTGTAPPTEVTANASNDSPAGALSPVRRKKLAVTAQLQSGAFVRRLLQLIATVAKITDFNMRRTKQVAQSGANGFDAKQEQDLAKVVVQCFNLLVGTLVSKPALLNELYSANQLKGIKAALQILLVQTPSLLLREKTKQGVLLLTQAQPLQDAHAIAPLPPVRLVILKHVLLHMLPVLRELDYYRQCEQFTELVLILLRREAACALLTQANVVTHIDATMQGDAPGSSRATVASSGADDGASAASDGIDFEKFLAQVVAQLTSHPTYERTSDAMTQDTALTGLLNMLALLLHSCLGAERSTYVKQQLCEGKSVQRQGQPGGAESSESRTPLLSFLFHTCLFELPEMQVSGPSNPHSVPLCKSYSARSAAYNAIIALVGGSAANLQALVAFMIAQHDVTRMTVAGGAQGAIAAREGSSAAGGTAGDTAMSAQHLAILNREQSWYCMPAQSMKANCGYVGLRNLGATCYMNSCLQQFFMIKPFRHQLLQVRKAAAEGGGSLEEGMMRELQLMFSHMLESERRAYEPSTFCERYEGGPINVVEQQDVDEFLLHFVDKLEEKLKATTHPDILAHHFGGVLVNQLISDCGHRKERDEPFNCLSIDIKGKSKITDSLELYVEGETLSGDNQYECSQCAQKRDTLKRVCIKRLPNCLVVHMKRFEFDLELMRKYKINDFCEFPRTLDMEPYTKEGLEWREKKGRGSKRRAASADFSGPVGMGIPTAQEAQMADGGEADGGEAKGEGVEEAKEGEGSGEGSGECSSSGEDSSAEGGGDEAAGEEKPNHPHPPSYYQYVLVGVLVHTGTSDSGHYYSYIKEQKEGGSSRAASSDGRWLCFNDASVSEFNPEHLASGCFGGSEWVSKTDSFTKKTAKQWLPKPYNAYALFYERAHVEPPEAEEEAEDALKATADAVSRADAKVDAPEVPAAPAEAAPVVVVAGGDEAVGTAGADERRRRSKSEGEGGTRQGMASMQVSKEVDSVDPMQLVQSGGGDADRDEYRNVMDALAAKPSWDVIPQQMLTTCRQDNLNFLVDRQVIDALYFKFVLRVLQQLERSQRPKEGLNLGAMGPQPQQPQQPPVPPPRLQPLQVAQQRSLTYDAQQLHTAELPMCQMATCFLVEALSHSKDKSLLDPVTQLLERWYQRCDGASTWLLKRLIGEGDSATTAYESSGPGRPGRWLRTMLLKCTVPAVRASFLRVLIAALKCEVDKEAASPEQGGEKQAAEMQVEAAGMEKPASPVAIGPMPPPDGGDAIRPVWADSKSLVARVFGALLSLLHESSGCWRRFEQYFDFFKEFAFLSPETRRLMLQSRCLELFIDFYLRGSGLESAMDIREVAALLPLSEITRAIKVKCEGDGVKNEGKQIEGVEQGQAAMMEREVPVVRRMGEKSRAAPLQSLFATIELLVRSKHMGWKAEHGTAPTYDAAAGETDSTIGTMTPGEYRLLTENARFLQNALTTYSGQANGNEIVASLVKVAQHLCFENAQLSTMLCALVVKTLDQSLSAKFAPYLQLFHGLLTLEDTLAAARVDECLTKLKGAIDRSMKYKNEACTLLRFLANCSLELPAVRVWLLANATSRCSWLKVWIFAEGCEIRFGAQTIMHHAEALCHHLIPAALPIYDGQGTTETARQTIMRHASSGMALGDADIDEDDTDEEDEDDEHSQYGEINEDGDMHAMQAQAVEVVAPAEQQGGDDMAITPRSQSPSPRRAAQQQQQQQQQEEAAEEAARGNLPEQTRFEIQTLLKNVLATLFLNHERLMQSTEGVADADTDAEGHCLDFMFMLCVLISICIMLTHSTFPSQLFDALALHACSDVSA